LHRSLRLGKGETHVLFVGEGRHVQKEPV
jgi:hypothetical protein